MKEIPLTKGMVALVDDEDYARLNQYKWNANQAGYAERTEYITGGSKRHVFMHHCVLGNPKEGMEIDHINRNNYDNRKGNLRFCTPTQNHGNTRIQRNNTSGRKGVSWFKSGKKWRAYIVSKRRQIHLGYYDTLEQASNAYDQAAINMFGEFAALNSQLCSLT